MLSVEHIHKHNQYVIRSTVPQRKFRSLTFIFNSYVDAKEFIDMWHVSPFRARFTYQARMSKH